VVITEPIFPEEGVPSRPSLPVLELDVGTPGDTVGELETPGLVVVAVLGAPVGEGDGDVILDPFPNKGLGVVVERQSEGPLSRGLFRCQRERFLRLLCSLLVRDS
jgi:hypothetical protein